VPFRAGGTVRHRPDARQLTKPDYVALLVGYAANVRFTERSFLLREGEPADRFFLIREGVAAVEIAAPGRDPIVVQTLIDGDVADLPSCLGRRPTTSTRGR
jgi:CRP-like cAMP-binding protein